MNIEISDILSWDTEQLWNYIQSIKEEVTTKETKTLLRQIEQGFTLLVPIQYFIKGYYEEHPSNKRVSIKGYGKFNLLEYWNDREARESAMRQIIMAYLEQDELHDTRLEDEE